MSVRTVQSIDQDGLTPAFSAASGGGDKIPWGESVFAVVKNGGGSPITVTVVSPGTESNLPIGDQAITVGAGAEAWIHLGAPVFRNAQRQVDLTYSGVTSVTLGAFQV